MRQRTARTDLRAEVTEEIVKCLEQGELPWRMPWVGLGLPANVVRKREYQGGNTLVLLLQAIKRSYVPHLWGTKNQWQKLGGEIRKEGGEGTCIVFWLVTGNRRNREHSHHEFEHEPYFTPLPYEVFNLDQVDQASARQCERKDTPFGKILALKEPFRPKRFHRYQAAEDIIKSTGARIRCGGRLAFYNSAKDYIQVPHRRLFRSKAGYYTTLFHELAHWTGHQRRLNRRFGKWFEDDAYAMEELVAELSAAFTTAEVGVPNASDQVPQHAAYIGEWLEILRKDTSAIFTAANHASRATDLIVGRGASRPTDMSFDELLAAKRFAERIGGIDEARRVLEMLQKLQ